MSFNTYRSSQRRTQEEADKAKAEAKTFNEALLASVALSIKPFELRQNPHYHVHRRIPLTDKSNAELKTFRDGDGRIQRLDLLGPTGWKAYARYPVKKDGTISMGRLVQDLEHLRDSSVARNLAEAEKSSGLKAARPAFDRVSEAYRAVGRHEGFMQMETTSDPEHPVKMVFKGMLTEATALRLIAALKETT